MCKRLVSSGGGDWRTEYSISPTAMTCYFVKSNELSERQTWIHFFLPGNLIRGGQRRQIIASPHEDLAWVSVEREGSEESKLVFASIRVGHLRQKDTPTTRSRTPTTRNATWTWTDSRWWSTWLSLLGPRPEEHRSCNGRELGFTNPHKGLIEDGEKNNLFSEAPS